MAGRRGITGDLHVGPMCDGLADGVLLLYGRRLAWFLQRGYRESAEGAGAIYIGQAPPLYLGAPSGETAWRPRHRADFMVISGMA